jgi:hypothetical protein
VLLLPAVRRSVRGHDVLGLRPVLRARRHVPDPGADLAGVGRAKRGIVLRVAGELLPAECVLQVERTF